MRALSVRTYPDYSYRSHATEDRLWSLAVRACQRVRGGSSNPEAGPNKIRIFEQMGFTLVPAGAMSD